MHAIGHTSDSVSFSLETEVPSSREETVRVVSSAVVSATLEMRTGDSADDADRIQKLKMTSPTRRENECGIRGGQRGGCRGESENKEGM